MKNRIIAVFLAFAVLVGVFSLPKRAHAAAAGAVAIVSIGVLAWEILDIMIKGEEPAIIVGIRTLLESGVDALTNPDSYFQQTYGDWWKDWGGAYDATYSMALEMYRNGSQVSSVDVSGCQAATVSTTDACAAFFPMCFN